MAGIAARKLFLGGLTKATTTELLYDIFSNYGTVVDAVVMERNGAPRGFGFVTFAQVESVDAVLMHPVRIDGREVDIKRAVPEEEMENAPTKVFVGGLPQKVDRVGLKHHFSRYGEVRDAVVMMDRSTGRSRGFGFVRFATADAVEAVLSAPQVLEGQVVDCKRAQPAEQLPPPKNPRSRGEEKMTDRRRRRRAQAPEVEMPDLTNWALAMLSMPGFQPEMPVGFGEFPSAFPQIPYWAFDPSIAQAPQLPLNFQLPEFPTQPFADLSNQSLEQVKARHGGGDENAKPNEMPDFAKLAALEPPPVLGDLSNLLNSRQEKRGFSYSLREAMKQEGSNAAPMAFGLPTGVAA